MCIKGLTRYILSSFTRRTALSPKCHNCSNIYQTRRDARGWDHIHPAPYAKPRVTSPYTVGRYGKSSSLHSLGLSLSMSSFSSSNSSISKTSFGLEAIVCSSPRLTAFPTPTAIDVIPGMFLIWFEYTLKSSPGFVFLPSVKNINSFFT